MTPAPPLPCTVHPVADGVLVVPHMLPVHIPDAALGMTVAEWLGITPLAQPL